MAWIRRDDAVTDIKDVFLKNIGVSDLNDVNEWFKMSYAYGYEIGGIDRAVSLIRQYKNRRITICGDYDVDGICATTILLLSLRWLGYKQVFYEIPKRIKEGFGLKRSMIDKIPDGLVITVDNGIAQPDVVEYAKQKGLQVIVTDHHEPMVVDGKSVLPNADIVIDPKAVEGQSGFKDYCGAGIAYKIACELLDHDKAMCRTLQCFAALGTIADVMPLREENYVIVRNGLKHMLNPSVCNVGLYALISSLGLNRCITSRDVGFKIGPCINAASRMSDDGPAEVIDLFTQTDTYQDSIKIAEHLIAVNESRKETKKRMYNKARDIIDEDCLFGEIPLVIYIPLEMEGIVGIIAGNLAEEFNTPAIVLTDAGNGILKGSGRSCGNYNMKLELDKVSNLLLNYGGHTGAAGLSLKAENLENLKAELSKNSAGYECDEDAVSNIYYDLEIDAKDIPKTIEELKKYEPFGEGNAAPVFKVNNFSVMPRYGAYVKWMGEDASIAKMYSSNATAVGFDAIEKMVGIKEPQMLNLVGTLSDNYFNGSVEHQIEFSDLQVSAATNKVETNLASRLKNMASH
jgi:single-stranded-DNA-specific exonuclease